jgi:hypothetical protein
LIPVTLKSLMLQEESAGLVARVESLPILTLFVRAGADGRVHSAGGGAV